MLQHSKKIRYLTPLLVLVLAGSWRVPFAGAQEAVVRAVLFYSPSCSHCHYVITETFPPLAEKYGDQLHLVGVDVSSEGGSALFNSAIESLKIPLENQAVPMLIVGETVLLGSLDIPEKFPGMIEQGLAEGGLDWPAIPGLLEALEAGTSESDATPTQVAASSTEIPAGSILTATVSPEPTRSEDIRNTRPPAVIDSGLISPDDPEIGLVNRVAMDPAGNTLSILVLVGLLVTIYRGIRVLRMRTVWKRTIRPSAWIPVLCAAGMVVAGYLSFVETAQVTAVCGPVGDCNTVQQSEYARLFGILPIGVLGLVGYLAILAAWWLANFGPEKFQNWAAFGLVGMALFGVLFSTYLTFLEPFVIGASCAWCLTSAVIMILLFWLSLEPGKAAMGYFSGRNGRANRRIAGTRGGSIGEE